MAQPYRVAGAVEAVDGADAGAAGANNRCGRPAGGTGAAVVVDGAGDAGAASAVANAVGAGDVAGVTAHANGTSRQNGNYHVETASAWTPTLDANDFAEETVQTWTAIYLHTNIPVGFGLAPVAVQAGRSEVAYSY